MPQMPAPSVGGRADTAAPAGWGGDGEENQAQALSGVVPCPFACLRTHTLPKREVTRGLVLALNLFRLRSFLEKLLKVMDSLPRKMPICQSNSRVHIISLEFAGGSRMTGEEGTGIHCLLLTIRWDPSQQLCPQAALPGCQGVVGHIGKVQKWEEVFGANHAKALGEVGVHPVGEERHKFVGNHHPGHDASQNRYLGKRA